MKLKSARSKGRQGEYDWRDIINKTFHTKYARTPLSGGLDIKGDIRKMYGAPRTIADDFHYEVKRVEKLNIHQAMKQAIRDAKPPIIPCVAFRKNNADWLTCLRAIDFLNLLVELQDLRKRDKKRPKQTDFEKWIDKKNSKKESKWKQMKIKK